MIVSNFERTESGGLIIVLSLLDNRHELMLAFDTGATHTTFDSNILQILGYQLDNKIDISLVETSNGTIVSDVYEFKHFNALGIAKENFNIQVYDFLSHGVLSDYDGILGLDFLEGYHFCIDTLTNEITIHD